MTDAELKGIVDRLLIEGVPPGIVARAFGLDEELVKEERSRVRVKRYGTDDLVEFAEQLQWDVLDEAKKVIATGSIDDKLRVANALIGKQMALAGRRTPEAVRDVRENMLAALETMRGGRSKPKASKSRFVAVEGG